MKDLDEHSRMCEQAFGMISGAYVFGLWEASVAQGSQWDLADDNTVDIRVTKKNADHIYAFCKEIRSGGYSVGISKKLMKAIKAARAKAHEYLYEEANDPNTPIQRKIELVKLTSKQQ